MEKYENGLNPDEMSENEIEEIEERRIERFAKAGVDEEAVLEKSRRNVGDWDAYFQDNITRGRADMDFLYKDNWTDVERQQFTNNARPCLTVNKAYAETKKIIGEQRKNKPELMVRSLNGKATQEQLDLRTDLVRTIAYQSQNDLVYQVAFRAAMSMGFGAFQVMIDFESPRSFKKIIRYDVIHDPSMCSWDISAIKPHKGDGNFCSRRYFMSLDEFYATYPYISNPVSYPDPYFLNSYYVNTKDLVCINDEFVKEWYPLLIFQLSNGEVVTKEQWREREKTFEDMKEHTKDLVTGKIVAREIPRIVNERQTQDYKIMHYRELRDQVIDFSEWPSRQLPIPFVDGDSQFIDGRQITKSYINEIKDSQKLLNYAVSELAAELKNRRREQWMATPENISGYEDLWKNPESQNGTLVARPDPKTGMMPQKMPAWDIAQGLFVTAQMSGQNIREVLGNSESEQLQGRDISGLARRERKIETSMSSYSLFDNLNQAIAQGGRIVNDLMPYIVGNDERSMVVTKRDGKSEPVTFNKMQGDKLVNQLVEGDYDVEIDVGASFAVQKEIALEFLQQTMQVYPQAFPLIADLWTKNLDVQFMPQMAERFKSIVPPEIIAKEEGKQLPPKQPSPQEQMMAMEMKNKQQEIMERAKELQIRESKHELEKAELMLKAKEMTMKGAREDKSHQVELAKADMDFSSKIAKIIADMNKV